LEFKPLEFKPVGVQDGWSSRPLEFKPSEFNQHRSIPLIVQGPALFNRLLEEARIEGDVVTDFFNSKA
jgi:hypothetical protein